MIIISLRIFIMKALSYYCATEGWGLRDRLRHILGRSTFDKHCRARRDWVRVSGLEFRV